MGLLTEYRHMIDEIIANKNRMLTEIFGVRNLYCDCCERDNIKSLLNAPDSEPFIARNIYNFSPIDIMEHIIQNDPIILRLGIVFQRWKIVIEKMIYLVKARQKCDVDQGLRLVIDDNRNIIVLDRILTRIQEMIFYKTKNVCIQILQDMLGFDQDNECKNIKRQKLQEPDDEKESAEYNLTGKIYEILLRSLENPLFVMNRPQPIHNIVSFDVTKLFDHVSVPVPVPIHIL